MREKMCEKVAIEAGTKHDLLKHVGGNDVEVDKDEDMTKAVALLHN